MYYLKDFNVILLLLCTTLSITKADYKCICNYNIEKEVFSSTDTTQTPVGFMYEFDCKPAELVTSHPDTFFTIQFEKQVNRYVVFQLFYYILCI